MEQQVLAFAKELRQNMTDAEQLLWKQLRAQRFLGLKFRRQVPIGDYIADFACFEARLIIELDGGQHAEQEAQDGARDAWLHAQGFAVLRFWNHEVLGNLEGVLAVIQRAVR